MKKLSCLFLFLVLFLAATGQTNQWPKTLLWRISGKGLMKPSFLYGTMHLQDKRLFYFGDSLYRCLEQADGYALEIDLREAIDSMLDKGFQKEERALLNGNDKETVAEADYGRKKTFVDSLFKNLKKGDKESKRKLEEIRREQVNNVLALDMPTFVDAYLYGIAKRQGKIIGAVEDVQDQLGIVDELGNKLDTSDFLESDEKLRFTLEDMIRTYMAQDLNRIEEYDKKGFSDEMQDKLFLKRNTKMARRMDSLSHIHSFFFAVGAGHLPGDSGVINLLKKRGYTVEPIFAKQRVSPEKYAATLNAMPWQTIEDTNRFYKIEMPDKATDFTLLGQLMKMKVNVDITTMTYYMVGQTIMNRNVDKMEEAFKEMAQRMGDPVPENAKHITKDSIEGVEGIVNFGYGYYKLQLWYYGNALYMVMAGNKKRQALFSDDANRYFQSFTINKKQAPLQHQAWVSFNSEEKAFSAMFPAQPGRNKAYEKNTEKSSWDLTVYDCIDINAGLYYMLQVRDVLPGFYLDGDSAYFEQFKSGMAGMFKDTIKNEKFFYKGFPALQFDGHSNREAVFYRTLTVNRGNRVYILSVMGSNSALDNEDVQKFFDSFALIAYRKGGLKKQYAADNSFYTTASFPFTLMPKDTAGFQDGPAVSKIFVSYNTDEAVSYQVFKDEIPAYQWYENDSSLYGISEYNNDSVISYTQVTNGKLKGMERVVYLPGNNNRKIIRKLLNGDTVYTLLSFIPSQYLSEERHRRFFEDFRVVNENAGTTAFSNKAEKLLTALLSKDSLEFEQAKAVLGNVSFSKTDLPLLHKALLQTYMDDSTGYGINSRIENIISRLADSSTVNFIRANYAAAGKDEARKSGMIDILSGYHTKYSYDLLKQLLLSDPPQKRTGYSGINYRISDSVELCLGLYPEYLKLSANKYLWNEAAYTTNKLLDSSRISLATVLPYKNNFLYSADTVLKSLRKLNGKDEGYEYSELVELLGKFNDSRSNQLLQQYQKLKNTSLRQSAVVALLKNNQPADAATINKLAEDRSTRKLFYDDLKKIHKERFFPAKYLTQRYFAESEVYSYASDDYEPSEVEYRGERIINFDGSKQKFYLFKVIYSYDGEEEPEAYLAVAGPYKPNNAKDLKTNSKGSGLQYDKQFSAEALNELFESFIASQEKLIKEHPEWYKSE